MTGKTRCVDGCGKMVSKNDIIVIREYNGEYYQVCKMCNVGGIDEQRLINEAKAMGRYCYLCGSTNAGDSHYC